MEDILAELDALTKNGNLNLVVELFTQNTSEDCIPARLSLTLEIIKKLEVFIQQNEQCLISVKQHKTLNTCFQLITSLGLLPCLLPGLGVAIEKRSEHASKLPTLVINVMTKYEYLKLIIDFFNQAYNIPILKNVIMTYHLSDYLAGLIQLSFAPLKKPGVYGDFNMTQELYEQLHEDRLKYCTVYEHLVVNSFQPTLMKELLLLQSMQNPPPPKFAVRVISKELTRRLLASGGLLSLMRCFIESYRMDIGSEWKQIELLCKIVTTVQGSLSEEAYLHNICGQLKDILTSNNSHYITVSSACLQSLSSKYEGNKDVKQLLELVLETFDCNHIKKIHHLPGTLLYSASEIENKISLLYACFISKKMGLQFQFLSDSTYILFLLRSKVSDSSDIFNKISELILYYLEECDDVDLEEKLNLLLYGEMIPDLKIEFVEIENKIHMKSKQDSVQHSTLENVSSFLSLIKSSLCNSLLQKVFTYCLQKLCTLTSMQSKKAKKDLMIVEDDIDILDSFEQNYAATLQLLEDLCCLPAVIASTSQNPSILINLIKTLVTNNNKKTNESTSVALVLLTTLLDSFEGSSEFERSFNDLLEPLEKLKQSDMDAGNQLLITEALTMLKGNKTSKNIEKSKFDLAINNVMDGMLPVRAHGIMELTKLIESRDPETISKKHYILCIFQEHLKDDDSYLYLASINGLAALGKHCTEDVLQVLCKEFLEISTDSVELRESAEKKAELRMKVGDVVVKVTSSLGEMAVVYKSLLLNTMLCGCRDEDPLIRASALSNLAEIARVIGYKVGTLIYEILLCIWNTIDSDKCQECRRAAVMVIASLLKGIDKSALLQYKEVLLPIYRSLKQLYSNENEDQTVRLHAQLALEELNATVNEFLFPKLDLEKRIYVLDKPDHM